MALAVALLNALRTSVRRVSCTAPSRSEELVEHLLKAVEMALFHIATPLLDPISEYHRPRTRCLSRTGRLRLAALAAEQVTQDLTQDVIISGLMRSGCGTGCAAGTPKD